MSTLWETEIKGARLINLVKEILRQSNVQAVAWILLAAFRYVSTESQEQKAYLKVFILARKAVHAKVVPWRARLQERLKRSQELYKRTIEKIT